MPSENPPEQLSARDILARAQELAHAGERRSAARIVGQLSDVSTELPLWLAAARVMTEIGSTGWARRHLKLAVLGSHTTSHLAALLPVAAARHGLSLTLYEAPYGQYQQQILDPSSDLYAFRPDVVLLAIDRRELRFAEFSQTPEEDLEAEVERWQMLWAMLRQRAGAVVVQQTFVPTDVDPLGNLALSLPGSRRRQTRQLNLELGRCARDGVLLVDAEIVAARVGLAAWNDDRYWFLSKHAVGLAALPELSRAIAAVVAAGMGLSKKVVVVDLDNTLWGGVIGEDGLSGIVLGAGAVGEAHQALQEYLKSLRSRGVVLAVVSKNNESDARAPFVDHPDMRLSLDDFAAFRATWEDKPTQIRALADELSIGLDSFVFVDDNPFEREGVRRELPEVDVVQLPNDATGFVAALGSVPGLEPAALTNEDRTRTEQYQARAKAAKAAATAGSRDEFLAGLEMVATFGRIDETSIDRVVQLFGKTNQFNTTTRRHQRGDVERLLSDPGSLGLTLRLRDRFADHGLVGVVLAVPDGTDLRIDSWLMSCRVLGRDVELPTMRVLTDLARGGVWTRVIGEYVPTARNAPTARAFPLAGFRATASSEQLDLWEFDLSRDKVPDPRVVAVELDTGLTGDLSSVEDEALRSWGRR